MFDEGRVAVGGCEYKDGTDPGNLQFDWLDVQLGLFRERKMQVWITSMGFGLPDACQVWIVGHVPPTPGNYFPECVSGVHRSCGSPLKRYASFGGMQSCPCDTRTRFWVTCTG